MYVCTLNTSSSTELRLIDYYNPQLSHKCTNIYCFEFGFVAAGAGSVNDESIEEDILL